MAAAGLVSGLSPLSASLVAVLPVLAGGRGGESLGTSPIHKGTALTWVGGHKHSDRLRAGAQGPAVEDRTGLPRTSVLSPSASSC